MPWLGIYSVTKWHELVVTCTNLVMFVDIWNKPTVLIWINGQRYEIRSTGIMRGTSEDMAHRISILHVVAQDTISCSRCLICNNLSIGTNGWSAKKILIASMHSAEICATKASSCTSLQATMSSNMLTIELSVIFVNYDIRKPVWQRFPRFRLSRFCIFEIV